MLLSEFVSYWIHGCLSIVYVFATPAQPLEPRYKTDVTAPFKFCKPCRKHYIHLSGAIQCRVITKSSDSTNIYKRLSEAQLHIYNPKDSTLWATCRSTCAAIIVLSMSFRSCHCSPTDVKLGATHGRLAALATCSQGTRTLGAYNFPSRCTDAVIAGYLGIPPPPTDVAGDGEYCISGPCTTILGRQTT